MLRKCWVFSLSAAIVLAAGMSLEWQARSPLPRAQAGGAAARFGHMSIIAGGTTWEDGTKLWLPDVHLYDSRLDQWRPGPALPTKLAYGPFAASASELEIFGGSTGNSSSRAIWRIGSSLRQWTQNGETPGDHLLGRAARIGQRVFLFGGCPDLADLTKCSDAVWMREGRSPWRQIAKLPGGAVALSASAVLGSQIYFFGGCSMAQPGQLVNRAEAWAFDPLTFAFRRLRDLPAKNRGLTATAAQGRVWLFGGYTASLTEAAGKGPEFGFTANVWTYDPVEDTYSEQTPLPVAISSIEFLAHGRTLTGTGGEHRMKSRSRLTYSTTIR